MPPDTHTKQQQATALERATERARDAARAITLVRVVPPLAVLAVVAAMVELLIGRLGWHGLADVISDAHMLNLRRIARVPRNLAAIAGVISLGFAFVSFLRLPGTAPIGRRLAVAAFAGIFLPSMVVATVFPAAALRPRLVIFGLAAANVLVALIGLSATRYRAPKALRFACALAVGTALSALALIALAQFAHFGGPGLTWVAQVFRSHPVEVQSVLLGMRHAGELAFLSVIVACTFTLARRPERGRRSTWIFVASFLLIASTFITFQLLIGHRFRLLLFGVFRLAILVDELPILYVPLLSLGLSAGLSALLQKDRESQQLGAAMLFWLAAGFAPHTPIQFLYAVLAITLMGRVAQALDRGGSWRDRRPWSMSSPPRVKPGPRVGESAPSPLEQQSPAVEQQSPAEPPEEA